MDICTIVPSALRLAAAVAGDVQGVMLRGATVAAGSDLAALERGSG